MRALPFLFLTAAYFVIAVASYSQVSAEDGPTVAGVGDCTAVMAATGKAGPDCLVTGSN